MENGDWGIHLWLDSDNNLISSNKILRNGKGILVDECLQNVIIENTIMENNGWAIQLKSTSSHFGTSEGNLIYHNNFINNKVDGLQVSIPGIWTYPEGLVPGMPNSWDNGVEGNYWSDFKTRYSNATQLSGITTWNTQYYINENNIDRHPLTIQFVDAATTSSILITPSPSLIALPSQSPSQTLVPSPSIPEFPTVIVVFLVLVSALLIIYKKREG